jgi:hypothetical protein
MRSFTPSGSGDSPYLVVLLKQCYWDALVHDAGPGTAPRVADFVPSILLILCHQVLQTIRIYEGIPKDIKSTPCAINGFLLEIHFTCA